MCSSLPVSRNRAISSLGTPVLIWFVKAFLKPANFLLMKPRQRQKHRGPSLRQRDEDESPVIRGVLFADQPSFCSPIHQLHRRVVVLLQEFREFGNCGLATVRAARNAEQ